MAGGAGWLFCLKCGNLQSEEHSLLLENHEAFWAWNNAAAEDKAGNGREVLLNFMEPQLSTFRSLRKNFR